MLGPLLFLIFINDLPCYLENTFSILFADDTTVLFSQPTIDEVLKDYNVSLEKRIGWCNFNNLSINWDKRFVMFITKKRIILQKFLKFKSINITVVDVFKLLGIAIDSKLTLRKFVSEKCNQINKRLYSIKKIFFLSFDV